MGILRFMGTATALKAVFSPSTVSGVRRDVARLRTRAFQSHRRPLPSARLHLGCGTRRFPGWLNVDLADSDWNVDLTAVPLPWSDRSFDVIVAQHVIEHLELHEEVLPLLAELHRICRLGAEVWLSTPDMEKVCRHYLADQGEGLLQDRLSRHSRFSLNGAPVQHIVNELFHQGGEHKNLFDFGLLSWALAQAGFTKCSRATEPELLRRHPDVSPRHDDYQSLYVVAQR